MNPSGVGCRIQIHHAFLDHYGPDDLLISQCGAGSLCARFSFTVPVANCWEYSRISGRREAETLGKKSATANGNVLAERSQERESLE